MNRARLAGNRVQPGSDSVLRKCFAPLNLRAMARIRNNLHVDDRHTPAGLHPPQKTALSGHKTVVDKVTRFTRNLKDR